MPIMAKEAQVKKPASFILPVTLFKVGYRIKVTNILEDILLESKVNFK